MNDITNSIISPFSFNSTAATHAVAMPKPDLIAEMKRTVQAFDAQMARIDRGVSDEIAAWMREQGCDPADGWLLSLHVSQQCQLPTWPSFVKFNVYFKQPIFLNAKAVGL